MDDYGVQDLRQLMDSSSRTQFCTALQFSEPFSVHRNLTPIAPHYQHYQQQQQPIVVGHELVPSIAMSSTSAANNGVTTSSVASLYGLHHHHLEHGWNINVNGIVSNDGDPNNINTSRWPRQETLTLLEIRSALDSKFKETNQKGPLWEDVSRIMAEEHGYQRSGKKCKEKFENLYKYYKKTKEGKAGRQDGKHYRFFRQLDAIYGKTTNSLLYDHSTQNYDTSNQESQQVVVQDQKFSESLSYSTHEFETSSTSENNDHDHDFSAIDFMMNQSVGKLKNGKQTFAKVKKSWKAKMEVFVNSEMRKVIEKQEAWMEKMLKSVEDREEESLAKEEERRKQEMARLDQLVHGFWAKERAWIEARDAAIMEALCKFTGKRSNNASCDEDDEDDIRKEIANGTINCHGWTEHEVASLIQLRTLIQESGYLKEGVWEEIAAKMGCLGYNRSVEECKEKWEIVSSSVKCEDDDIVKTSMYFGQVLLSSYELGSQQDVSKQMPEGNMGLQLMDEGLSSPSSSSMNYVNSRDFHIGINEGENLWERYGVKLSKGNNQ